MNKVRKTKAKLGFVCAAMLFALAGCANNSAQMNTDFAEVVELSEFSGAYKNAGQGDAGAEIIYLSHLIWPATADLEHAKVERVEVSLLESDELLVEGLRDHETLLSRNLVLQQDFEIDGGQIVLKQEGGISGWLSGEPMTGPYYGSVALGLDSEGNGIYRSRMSNAGLAFMFLPIIMGGGDDISFERIE